MDIQPLQTEDLTNLKAMEQAEVQRLVELEEIIMEVVKVQTQETLEDLVMEQAVEVVEEPLEHNGIMDLDSKQEAMVQVALEQLEEFLFMEDHKIN